MQKFLLIFFSLIVSFAVAQNREETMDWSEGDKLIWENFKGVSDPKMEAVALTASGLTFGYSMKQSENNILSFIAEVYAHFYPNRSWVKEGRETEYILGHEQLHFDITELHARMLRKELSEVRITNNLKRVIQQIHNRINMDMDKMQIIYDRETNHSLNKEAQERWQKDIAEALRAMADYASPKITVGQP